MNCNVCEFKIRNSSICCKLYKNNGNIRYLKFNITEESYNLLKNKYNFDNIDVYKKICSIKYESEVYKNIKDVNILSNKCEIYNISSKEFINLLGDKDNKLYNSLIEYIKIDNLYEIFDLINFNVIDLPYVVYDSFFNNIYKNKLDIWDYIKKIFNIFKFYESIEFMHNDIHLSNIFIDEVNKNPIIYDFNASYHKSISDNIYVDEYKSQYNRYIKNVDMMRFVYHFYGILHHRLSKKNVYNLIHGNNIKKKFYNIFLKKNDKKNINSFIDLCMYCNYCYYDLKDYIRDIDEIIEILDNY